MIYKFSTVSLHCEKKYLSINDRRIDVDDRMFDLLLTLVQHYPEHCSKQTLLDALWPETVVSDWSISKLVSDTRQELKRHGVEPEVIQTLSGRGYRLSNESGASLEVVSPQHTPPPTTQAASSKPRVFAFFTALVVMGAVGLGLTLQPSDTSLKKSEKANSVGRLLWVDDHPENNQAEKAYLEARNITVYQVTSSEDALTSLALYQYNAVISDMGRNGEVLAGLNLLKSMRERGDQTPFLLYTIVLSEAQQQLMTKYQGQGVAVESGKLYDLVLPFFPTDEAEESASR